jgi:hypothetical protein
MNTINKNGSVNLDNSNFSFGVGKFISKIENGLINFLISIYKNISKLIISKYNSFLHFVILNILNTEKLNLYSKITILTSICIFLLKCLTNIIISNKIKIDKCSYNNYLFFNNKIIKNKTSLLEKESQIKILKKEGNWTKVKRYIEKNNKIFGSKLHKKEINEKDPFFKILKFYIDYECQGKNKIKRE